MKTVRVGEVAEQLRGVTFSKGDAVPSPRDGYVAVLTAGNIQDGRLVISDLTYVPAGKVTARQQVRRHDVVICTSSGSLRVVGKAAQSDGSFAGGFGAFLKVLRPGPEVDPRYFAHYFQTQGYRRTVSALAAGANINNLKNQHLDDLVLPLPPVPEQRRIAAILDHADAIRAKRRRVLTRLDALSQSIFHEMFGAGGSWPLLPIAELGKVTTGRTPPTASGGMFGGPIPFVTPGDLGTGVPAVRTVTEAGAAASRVVRAGSTLVCCIGTIGKVDAATQPCAFNQQINAVEWGDEIDDAYGLAAMRSMKPTIVARGGSTTLPLLPKGQFVKLEMQVPPLELQRAFAARVAAIARQRMLTMSASVSDAELFASLQSRAFRGEL